MRIIPILNSSFIFISLYLSIMQEQEYYIESTVKIDEQAPSFSMPFYDPKTKDQGHMDLSDLKGKWSVLFYYPADFTFVCPTELKDMADCEAKFQEM